MIRDPEQPNESGSPGEVNGDNNRSDHAKKLAAGIPNAELLVLETANHLPLLGHPTWDVFFEAFCRFLKIDS